MQESVAQDVIQSSALYSPPSPPHLFVPQQSLWMTIIYLEGIGLACVHSHMHCEHLEQSYLIRIGHCSTSS